jgi:KAP family P-loop domain
MSRMHGASPFPTPHTPPDPMNSGSTFATAPFLSDRPITTRERDRLDLAPFVDRLVRPILLTPDDGGFVVGLYGPWGSGKSSALAFLESGLESANEWEGAAAGGMPYTLVVRFSPWLYSGTETLLPAFFDTLAGAVGRMTKAPEAKRHQLEGAIRAIGEIAVPAASLAATVFGGPFAGNIATKIAEMVKGAASGTADIMEATAPNFDENIFRQQRDTAAKLLREMKAGLRPIRVVMTIDDLDRAAGVEEVLAMLKLIKLIADLPNVVYVIAMDRMHVEDLLSAHVSRRFGLEYLDKIVQIGFAVPAAEPAMLTRWLVDEATEIAISAGMDAASLTVNWDSTLGDYLPSNSFERILRGVLRTPRDVVRILSMYRFAASAEAGAPPLHAVDLLLLSSLLIIAPRVYDAVRVNGRFLLHLDRRISFDNDGRERADEQATREARLRSILHGEARAAAVEGTDPKDQGRQGRDANGAAGESSDPSIRRLVMALFPDAITSQAEGRDQREVRRMEQVDADAYRIAAPERFATYFRFAPPPDTAAVSLVREVFELMCGGVVGAIASATQSVPMASSVAASTPTWVTTFDTVCANLAPAVRESLIDQIGDKMANLSREGGRAVAARLPEMARHSTTDVIGPTMRWAAHVVDVLTTYRAGGRGERTTEEMVEQDSATAPKFLVQMVEAYASRELRLGVHYADDVSNDRGYSATCPTPESQREVAVLGVRLGEKLLEDSTDVFTTLGTYDAGNIIWTYVRMLNRAGIVANGARHGPLESYLKTLVETCPARLGDVFACVANWREDGTPYLDRRRAAEARESISQLVDPEWIDEMVRRSTDTTGDADTAIPLSHENLVLSYRGFLDSRTDVQEAPEAGDTTPVDEDI